MDKADRYHKVWEREIQSGKIHIYPGFLPKGIFQNRAQGSETQRESDSLSVRWKQRMEFEALGQWEFEGQNTRNEKAE